LSKAGSWKPTTTLTGLLGVIIDVIDNPSIDKPMNAGLFRTVEYCFLSCIYFVVEAAKDYDQARARYEQKAIQQLQKTGIRRS
jgi:ubiquitin-protein ligase